MKLLIISHTPHYMRDGEIVGWGPTVREIDQLASLFDQIVHLAPLHNTAAPASSLAYSAQNLRVYAVRPAGGNNLAEKFSIIWRLPQWLAAMRTEMKLADAIHIRCPASISLVALLAARLWGKHKPCWVKYAGSWGKHAGQAWSYRLQQDLLKRNFHHGAVTINATELTLPAHFSIFINPSFTEQAYQEAAALGRTKTLQEPIRFVFVGRLDESKGAGRVLAIADRLHQVGLDFCLDLIGDGPDRTIYETLVRDKPYTQRMNFAGWLPREKILSYYAKAHFSLLPSITEGWPKVLSEAMAYGVVPIASTAGSIAPILEKAKCGRAIPSNDLSAYVKAIIGYTKTEYIWKEESIAAIEAAKEFSFEAYLKDVRDLFKKHWEIDLKHV